MRIARLALLVALVALALGACGNDDDVDVAGESPPAGTLTVDAADFRFDPLELQAKAGSEVTVVFRNAGNALHNFSIVAPRVSQDVRKGETKRVKFTAPDAPATVRYFCEYHEENYDMYGLFEFT